MNFNYIETFLSVVKQKNISRAAKELYIAQTTVTQRIKNLEKEIGLQLIERGKGMKEISLTPMGEEFYRLAEEWLRTKKKVDTLKNHGSLLNLMVGAVDSVNTFILPEAYRDNNARKNRMKLRIHTLHSDEIYAEVERRNIDIGFSLRDRVHSNVIVNKFLESSLVVIRVGARSGYSSKIVKLHELDPNYELFIPWSLKYIEWHSHWWDPLNVSRVRLDSTHLLLKLLTDPIQWAIVPRIIAEKAIKLGNYEIYELNEKPPNYKIYKLTHSDPTTFSKKAVESFESYLESRKLVE
jgi:DNA-binding transcriptional LysR family regulator